jgi:hypothetical protein
MVAKRIQDTSLRLDEPQESLKILAAKHGIEAMIRSQKIVVS